MLNILKNRNFILALAIVLGIFFGDFAFSIQKLTIPALMLAMTVSTIQIDLKVLFALEGKMKQIISAFIVQYILLGGFMLLLAWILMPSEDLWIGYVLIAAAPPGVAILPFTNVVKGDMNLSFIGTIVLYFVALLVMPLMIFLFAGGAIVSPYRIILILVQLIIVPMLLSQIVRGTQLKSYIEKQRGNLINWSFFIITYTVVGLNRAVFISQPVILFRIFLVAFISIVIILIILSLYGKSFAVTVEETRSLKLLGSMKNAGFSAGIALYLFNEAASIPSAVVSVFYALYFIYLGVGSTLRKTN